MAKNIFLVYNMGASGGSWLADVLNLHPEVEVWFEVNRLIPGIKKLPREQRAKAITDFMTKQYKENPKATIGLVKAFDPPTKRFCLENNGRIIQTLRNPIAVLYMKVGHKVRWNKMITPKEMFEDHFKFYLKRYRIFMERSGKAYGWPLYKMEDLNKSLKSDGALMKEMLEFATQIEWDSELIDKIKNFRKICPACKGSGLGPKLVICPSCKGTRRIMINNQVAKCGACKAGEIPQGYYWAAGGHGRPTILDYCHRCGGKTPEVDTLSPEAWNFWDSWTRDKFREYFDDVMKELGYEYPKPGN